MNSELRAFVYLEHSEDRQRAGRTLRSLKAAGVTATELQIPLKEDLPKILRAGGPILFLRAGAWLVRAGGFRWPTPSSTGTPLCAVGATRLPLESESATAQTTILWDELFARTGGDFSGHSTPIPLPCSFFLDSLAVRRLMDLGVTSFEQILDIAREEFRLVHYAPLDVFDDRGLRVLQVITSLQRGGAERVALDLMAELPASNTRVRLATVGRPMREAFPMPKGTYELAALTGDPETRGTEVLRIATEFGADLVHAHLLGRADIRSISTRGLPVVVTVHNTQPGWPAGMAELRTDDAALLVACARAVGEDLRHANLRLPIRAVRNGIALRDFEPTADRAAAGREWRQKLGFSSDDFVLAAVANPRPQKRLHLLPAVLAALRGKLEGQQARLVFVGEVLRGNPHAQRCLSDTQAEVARLGLEAHTHWTGPIADVAGILAAADVLVSTSAHEGLSLAQLEALAMGCSVVATNVGGAREIAETSPRFHLLPVNASPEQFAEVLVGIARENGLRGEAGSRSDHVNLPLDWSRQRMAARYRWLFPRAIVAARRGQQRGNGLWLIANNFSTGGAQTSARRLLLGLQAQGVRVRAVVVEEDPNWPTPGRKMLIEAGVPVITPPLDPNCQHEAAIDQILAALDTDPPESVLFWNLRPPFKVALADALLGLPIFDISPGEMFYESLESYFTRPQWRFGCRTAREYGSLLTGVIVKYRAEAAQATEFFGAPVHTIPNGVPIRVLGNAAPASVGRKNGHFVFGTAARINPRKRLEDLLAAFHLAHDRLPPYVLRIAGGVERGCADYAAELLKSCDGLAVEWIGEVNDVAGFHRELDAFAMISEPAGCPNASLEAIAAGLPLIATDFGGASEQVIDKQSGRLVPARNPEALASALIELATQPELCRHMSLAGSQLVRERFSLERMIADYRRICLPNAP